jgi:glucokinase
LISPDTILLGGGLVEAMPELYLEAVTDSARSHVLPSYRESFRVVSAQLGDDATATGAAAWAQETLKSKGNRPKDL